MFPNFCGRLGGKTFLTEIFNKDSFGDCFFYCLQANGFHEGSGMSGYIPSMYVNLSERFFHSTRPDVRLFEYSRPNWSFHGKGLWIDSHRLPYSATLVGSSNYGEFFFLGRGRVRGALFILVSSFAFEMCHGLWYLKDTSQNRFF